MEVPQTEITIRNTAGVVLLQTTVAPGEYVLGRSPEAELFFEAELVSRQHARLTVNFDHLLIEDLGSANGTSVNGQPVTDSVRLWPNQKVQLGTATLEFRRVKTVAPPDVSLAPSAATVQRLLPEELLREKKYEIGRVVAQGGMGAILDARDAAAQRSVAMKVMLDGSSSDDLTRFIAEARVTAQLEHPNIVPVHELSVDENGQPYYTMKMVRGITLKKVLELLAQGTESTVKKYPLPALLTIFQKVCDAVAFAHSHGVIHRDLKPENIMLGDFGEVLLMDWGLAKQLGGTRSVASPTPGDVPVEVGRAGAPPSGGDVSASATLSGTIMGTPHYMAPEQARGEVETMDQRADIYALGAILYHLLALRPSVGDGAAMTIVGKVALGKIEPLTAPAAGAAGHLPAGRIPDSLAAVVRQAMAFDPAQRYADVASLQADIVAYQSGFATSAERAGLGKLLLLAIKRNKIAAAGIAAVLFVGTIFGTHAFLQGRRAERALAELKKSAPAFAAEADSLLLKGDVEGALARLATAIQLDGENPRWPARQGQILDAALRFPEAAAAYTRAAALDPGGPWKEARAASEKLAAARKADGTYPTAPLRELYQRALKEDRPADALLLGNPLKLAAAETLPLWQAKLNAWLGKDAPSIRLMSDGGMELRLVRMGLSEITPLKGMPLTVLNLFGNERLSDLSPLVNMPLVSLDVTNTKVSDLSPLTGMKLTKLLIANTPVTDLTPLRGMPLVSFQCSGGVTDISPLRDSPLTGLARFDGSRFTDLSPLAGKKPQELILSDVPLKNIEVIRGMPVKQFHLRAGGYGPELIDLVLSLPRLEILTLNPSTPGFERLRTHPTLKFIGHDQNKPDLQLPVADYWRAYDERTTEAQKNALLKLDVRKLGDGTKRLQLQDPALTAIPQLDWTNVSVFIFFNTKISDLSPLRGVKLRAITFFKTPVADLEPLRGSPVVKLAFMETAVTDVSPLLDCPNLEAVSLSRTVKNVEVLRKHPKLRHIGYTEGPGPDYLPETTAEEFWRVYDAKTGTK